MYLIQVFNQYLMNKKDDACPFLDTNLPAYVESSLWRCHEHSMVKFASTRSYLIPPICMCITKQVWAWEGCTSANLPHCILRTETKASSAKDPRMYHMITKYFHAPWNYQMNLRVSLWFLFYFVLFSFRTNLWPLF